MFGLFCKARCQFHNRYHHIMFTCGAHVCPDAQSITITPTRLIKNMLTLLL